MNEQINCIEEDEIDLRELFYTIKKNIFKIALFSIVITSITLVYVLSIPNSYKSQTVLVAQQQAKSSMGGLSALAGLAGVNLGSSGGGISALDSMRTILDDYGFNAQVIQKYHLDEKLLLHVDTKNFVYPFGLKLFEEKAVQQTKGTTKEDINFATFKILQDIITISSDKKSGTILLSVEYKDRFLAKKLLDIYLKEITTHLRKVDMLDINQKIKYYNEEIANTSDIELKKQLNSLISALIQKKVLARASEFYIVKKITDARIAYIKDKSKPKRSLILIVSFVTSIILAIFGVFFLEFLKKDDEKEHKYENS